MGYIWNNYDRNKEFYISMESPYMETWDSTSKSVGVNIDVRLDSVFFPQEYIGNCEEINNLYRQYEQDPRYKDIFNIVCHYIVLNDRCRGVTYKDFIEINTCRQIESGYYGEKAKKCFEVLLMSDKKKACRCIAKYEYSERREMQFDMALKYIFDDVNLYYEQSTGVVRVCINRKKNEYNEKLFHLICYFLQDIKTEVEVYWLGEHFGIIGVDETMQMDSVALI